MSWPRCTVSCSCSWPWRGAARGAWITSSSGGVAKLGGAPRHRQEPSRPRSEFPRRNCPKSPDRSQSEASEGDKNEPKKPCFSAPGIRNGGFKAYSSPFSDSFDKGFPETRVGLWGMLHSGRVDFSMLLGLIFLLLVGAGAWSLDAVLARKRERGKPVDTLSRITPVSTSDHTKSA